VTDAPSGRRLAQPTANDDYRFPIALHGPELKDLRLAVKCKLDRGKGDRAVGICGGSRRDNYYITRANALEDNVHLYTP